MLTIKININMLKRKLKKTTITILKALSFISCFSGILWILGTAGQSDNNAISFYQVITQSLQGIMFCGIAYLLKTAKIALQ